MLYFPKIGGPEHRSGSNIILIMGTPKKVPLIFGTLMCLFCKDEEVCGTMLPDILCQAAAEPQPSRRPLEPT